MTTIVYRKGVLAGDTRVTCDTTIMPEQVRKVFRLRDGSLFGSSGSYEEGELLLAAMRSGLALPKIEDKDTEALHIRTDGSVWLFEGRAWSRVDAPYVVIGSGLDYALGALAMGATAHQAVKACMGLDAYTGGRVMTVRLRR